MKRARKLSPSKIWNIGFYTCLSLFTVYMALDTFVLSRSYQTNANQINTSLFENADSQDLTSVSDSHKSPGKNSAGSADTSFSSEAESSSASAAAANSSSLSPVAALGTYNDDNISIVLNEYEQDNTAIYAAFITLSSTEYLKTAFADDTYGKNVTDTTSNIAADNNAILAINGDYYGAQESGIVIRNGIVYRDTASSNDVLAIYPDGSMTVYTAGSIIADELMNQGAWQAFSFGPALLENSQIAVTTNQEVGKAKASNPRTAIGWIDDNTFVFVVADGRTSQSQGLSLYQLAQFMKDLGCLTAYNLDGGGSSTMVFQGNVINHPTTSGNSVSERKVSDIVYIG